MRPRLVVGLGNPLCGDDAVGYRLAALLQADPRCPPDVEVVLAGEDLLAVQESLRGRREIWIMDAVLDADAGPEPTLVVGPVSALGATGGDSHAPNAAAALQLLRAVDPALRNVPIRFLGLTVQGAAVGDDLSPDVEGALGSLLTSVLDALDRPPPT